MAKYILFDLDGTLTDPKIGITTCVQYALKAFGIDEPDLDKLEPFIGPPLADSFEMFYGFDHEKALEGVAKYRERFATVGLFENEIYPGIAKMLKKLKRKGCRLAVASSKPAVFVEKILDYFHIRKYFDVVVGSELDGRRSDKTEVVREALKELFAGREDFYRELQQDEALRKETIYMVGDRKFDVKGATDEGVTSVAVAYGYGSMEELSAAGADYICRSVGELEELLLREDDYTGNVSRTVRMLIRLCLPVVAFLGTGALSDMLFTLLGKVTSVTLPAGVADIVIYLCSGTVAWFAFGGKEILRREPEVYFRQVKTSGIAGIASMALTAVFCAYGLNLLFELTGFLKVGIYAEIAAEQQAVSPVVSILLYLVAAPVAEEVLFRGILYMRAKEFTGRIAAAILSAVVFGLYHGNIVQGVYALLMGLLFAWFYEAGGHFYLPVIAHILANTVILIANGGVPAPLSSVPACIASLVIGAASLGTTVCLYRKSAYVKG